MVTNGPCGYENTRSFHCNDAIGPIAAPHGTFFWVRHPSIKSHELAASRFRETKTLAELRVEKAMVDGERQRVEADLGPVRYLAALIGTTDETTMRSFILIVALLLAPAAVVLLLAATTRK